MILGINGFADFQMKHHEYLNPNQIADFEGTFVLARWNESKLTIQTDLYSIYRLIYFANDESLSPDPNSSSKYSFNFSTC